MNDRELIRLALDTLDTDEFDVWVTKHYAGKGRRTGSHALAITEDAWRYRLDQATRKMNIALERRDAA